MSSAEKPEAAKVSVETVHAQTGAVEHTGQVALTGVAAEARETEASEAAFTATLDTISQGIPELRDDHEMIVAAGRELIRQHGLVAELFDAGHTVFFAALAQRYGRLKQNNTGGNEGASARDADFIHAATTMLAWDKQANFDEVKHQIDTDVAGETPGKERRVYEQFTDTELTQRLTDAIDNGLFAEAQAKMGIKPGEEATYDLFVLDIGFVYDDPAWAPYIDLGIDDVERRRLAESAETFREQGRMFSAGRSKGWVVPLDGRHVLALPKPVALAVIDGEGELREGNLKTVAHEFVHTQGDFTLDDQKMSYGALVEERRADIASDSKHYPAVEQFIDTDLYLASGHVLSYTVEEHIADKDPGAFWLQVAADFGLQRTLELGLTVPTSFVDKAVRPLQASVSEYLGGMDGIVHRAYEDNLRDPQQAAAMNERIQPHVDWYAEMSTNHPDEAEAWSQWCRKIGLGFMIGVIEEKVKSR